MIKNGKKEKNNMKIVKKKYIWTFLFLPILVYASGSAFGAFFEFIMDYLPIIIFWTVVGLILLVLFITFIMPFIVPILLAIKVFILAFILVFKVLLVTLFATITAYFLKWKKTSIFLQSISLLLVIILVAFIVIWNGIL